jgi:hypothetical protein
MDKMRHFVYETPSCPHNQGEFAVNSFKIIGSSFKTIGGSFKTIGSSFKIIGKSFKTIGSSFKIIGGSFKIIQSFYLKTPKRLTPLRAGRQHRRWALT